MTDPLADTLFRPTTGSPALVSAAPVRVTGTRTRAGNAMSRTRTALMIGAARAVELNGTKIAMAQVAVSAGVAKATLYNHFRTREAVLNALLIDQVERVIADQVGKPLEQALADAAESIGSNPVRAALARVEPSALAALGHVERTTPGWRCARAGVDAALAGAGRGGSEMVLRWLASFIVSPADAATIADDVAVLVAGLPVRPVNADAGSVEDARRTVARPRPTPRTA